MKILIVGGVAGGATIATKLRRNNEHNQIIVFEKGEHVSFANCGLPYYIGGIITDREKLLVKSATSLKKRYNLDVRINSEVIKIDEQKKIVFVKNKEKTYIESYDKLILSPGATTLDIGFQANNLFTLRNITDMDKIKKYMSNNEVKRVVVIGGGFVGIEIAENLNHLDIEVVIIDKVKHILNTYDLEMAAIIETNLKASGVKLKLSTNIINLNEKYIELDSGEIINTDLTISALGIKPLTNLAKNTSIELTKRGAFKVNNKFETSVEDIYAIGDAIEVYSPIIKRNVYIPLAGPTNRQATMLADIISGENISYPGTYGARVIKINDITAASVGFCSEYLKEHNIEHEQVITHLTNHASYYPNSSTITLKLVFNKETKEIYGAQVIGKDGIDKRIDVIATAIQLKMKVDQLQTLELAYSPPYNSVRDPINILSSIASNVINNKTKMVNFDQVDEFKNIIDVRTPNEFQHSNIMGSINIEVDQLRNIDLHYQKNEPILIYCRVGFRGYLAEQILRAKGYENVYNLSGGFVTYAAYYNNLFE